MDLRREWNQVALRYDPVVTGAPAGQTPAELIEAAGLEFRDPIVLLLNGQPLSRVDWPTHGLTPADVCRFVTVPRISGGGNKGGSNPLQILATVAVLAASWYVSGPAGASWFGSELGLSSGAAALAAKAAGAAIAIGGMALTNTFLATAVPTSPSIGTAGTVYSISSGSNQLKIDYPFAEQFGRLPVYPDLAQIPYTEYAAKNQIKPLSDQYLYFSGFITVGEIDFEKMFIGTTDADELDDVAYNILGPEDSPTIVTRLVWAGNDIAGHLMNHEPDDWSPATVVLNPPGTRISHIGWDLEFPAGCYYLAGYGYGPSWVLVLARARKVDDNGYPLTDWAVLTSGGWDGTISAAFTGPPEVSEGDFQFHLYCTIQPSRGSYYVPAPFGPGRYEFQIGGYDTETDNTDVQVCNKCYVGQVRGYGGAVPDYGDVTRVEAKIRASSQISGAVANQIKILSTRKLYPVGATGFGPSKIASESIVDASVYQATSENGGRRPDSAIDWAGLYALRTSMEASGFKFSWRYQTRSSVMEAMTLATKCGKAKPYLPGGILTAVQDAEATVNTMIFTEADYDLDSFDLVHTLPTASDPTGVRVKFIDSDKWAEDQLDYYDADGSDENLATVQLDGVIYRQQAHALSVWYYMVDKCGRTTGGFATGLKGHIPMPGSRIGIVTPPIKGENCGVIQKIDGTDVYLSAPADFDGEATALLTITDGGGILGPYTVTPGATATSIVATLPGGTPTVETHAEAAAKYVFGVPLAIKVDAVRPRGQNKVEIAGRIYDGDTHEDPGTVPALTDLDLLESVSLDYTGISGGDYAYRITWEGSSEAVKIELDEGGGYATEEDDFSDKYLDITTSANSITVKVTPYDGEELSTGDALTASHSAPPTVTGLALDGDIGTTWTVTWDDASADEYMVRISVDGAIAQTRYTTELTMSWGEDEMSAGGGPWASWDVSVYAQVDDEYGIPDTLACSPDALAAPASFGVNAYLPLGAVIEWSEVTGSEGYLLYSGATSDFDPEAAGTLEYSGTDLQATVTFETDTYYKVAAQSLYLTDVGDLTFSSSILAVIDGMDILIDDDGTPIYDDDDTLIYAG
jgi:sulfur carrier protein ThiS